MWPMARIRLDALADAIGAELSSYGEEVTDEVKSVVKAAGEDCKKDIQRRSPKRTGKYRKGWRSTVAYEGTDGIRVIVYNATDGQLTHLLENGHAKVGGGRVDGTPHIRPAEQAVERELLQKLREALQ